MSTHPGITIIGTGFAGLGMAIKLKEAGYHDFVILEKADDLGGTWRDNTYPGCACDVPSHMYSFSYELNSGWSRMFAPQAEIWDYLRACVDKYDLAKHLRFGKKVVGLEYDDATRDWRVSVAGEETFTTNAVVSGIGALHVPSFPAIPGRESFAGSSFHSAEWDHSVDLETRALGFTVDPRLMKIHEKMALSHLAKQVPDPALRARLTPDYTIGCKRILISNDYYPALGRENVEVITDGVREIRENSIVDSTGREIEVDVIVYGTGFKVIEALDEQRIIGRNGRKIQEAWQDGVEAYYGITTAGFPNLNEGGCRSWYLDEHGVNRTVWPGFTFEYWARTRRLKPEAYELIR
ncbi:flavin-containing monooxygenase [Streptosporangium amethystogenes]|uniref:flavin-containing monooxygenase n=1 Tax=Streptosporangium amethystogenes TaxID=2002 RepID=UPI0004CB86BD|nr:NAD(P)/FAD-dependent oxidoreductase [Streptosporangium amethystogenes]